MAILDDAEIQLRISNIETILIHFSNTFFYSWVTPHSDIMFMFDTFWLHFLNIFDACPKIYMHG